MSRISLYFTNIALGRERGPGLLLFGPVMWIISLLYGTAVWLVRSLYAAGLLWSFRAPVPVISVGNLTAGGTGKTPFVVLLYRILKEEGFHPMVLTRGYMGGQGGPSDEAQMLRELIGPRVFAGVDRVKSFHFAYKAGLYDCVILDDGFQHWRFRRDLDIVLIDSAAPFGNGALIPRGILRETRRALRRAQVLIQTRSDHVSSILLEQLTESLKRAAPQALIAQGAHRVIAMREAFTGSTLAAAVGDAGAFCAIGDPEGFRRTLEGLGIVLKTYSPFPDHYRYTESDLRKVVQDCRDKNVRNIFITHKDLVKLTGFRELFAGFGLIVIDVEFTLNYGKTNLLSSLRRLRRS